MKLLLDTHVLLWALSGDPRLSLAQAEAIEAGVVYISSASVWEIGIKRAIGKLSVPDGLFDTALDAGCMPLPISWRHADSAAALPPHHSDPFDRMLIAQAREEGLTLVSSDAKVGLYDVDLLG